MLISMTGYGKAEGTFNNVKYNVEIRSLNGRFNEVSLKCPKYLYAREFEIRDIVRQRLSRGKVSIFIMKGENDNGVSNIKFDEEALKNQIDILKKLRKKLGSKEKIKLEHLIELSEYFILEDEENIDENEFVFLKGLLSESLDNMFEMKKREGSYLEKDIIERIKNISEETDNIEKLSKERIITAKKSFNEKIDSYLDDRSLVDEKRLEYEIAMLTEKMDITEECVRLRSHLVFFIESINSEDNIGRRLNFLIQEINREINTIASKSMDAVISQRVSILKEELEKIREQIQNVE